MKWPITSSLAELPTSNASGTGALCSERIRKGQHAYETLANFRRTRIFIGNGLICVRLLILAGQSWADLLFAARELSVPRLCQQRDAIVRMPWQLCIHRNQQSELSGLCLLDHDGFYDRKNAPSHLRHR